MSIAAILYATALLAPLLAVAVPLSMAPLLTIAVVAAVGIHLWKHRRPPPIWPIPTAIVATALAWGAISVLWTTSPGYGLFAVGRLSFILLGGIAFAALATTLKPIEKRRIAIAVCSGVLLALLVLGLNVFLGGAVTEVVGVLVEIPPYKPAQMNRSATILAVFLWPALIAISTLFGGWEIAITLIGGFFVVAATESATAAIAVAAGILVIGAIRAGVAPAAVRRLIAAVVAVAVLGVPLYALGPDALANRTIASVFPSSFYHRIYIWRFVAGKIGEKPLAGWGLEGSRSIPDGDVARTVPIRRPDGSIDREGTKTALLPLHPHNAGLQIWLELGVPGVLTFFGLVLYLLRSAGSHASSREIYGFCLAQLLCVFLIAESSYGIWQSWWLSTIVLGAVFSIALLPHRTKQAEHLQRDVAMIHR